MKKVIFRFVLILGIMVLFPSCLTDHFIMKYDGTARMIYDMLSPTEYKMVLDENVGADESAFVTFKCSWYDTIIVVKQWNAVDARLNIYNFKNINHMDKTILTVPAGENTFTVDIAWLIALGKYTSYQMNNIEFPCNLEAGNNYEVTARSESLGFRKGYVFILEIHNVTDEPVLVREWKLGESSK